MMELSGRNFFQNLFGTIAGPQIFDRLPANISVIPLDGNGTVMGLKSPEAAWLGLRTPMMQKYAYEYCFPLAAVIDRLAEADISGVVEVLYAVGKGKENFAKNEWANQMNRLLDQPNPMQTWEQFRGQQNVYKRVFGYCPVLPIVPSGFENQPWFATTMINLPPWCFDVEPTNNLLYETELSGIVKRYTVTILGKTFQLTADQVIIFEDSFHQDENKGFLLPKSRLVGLDMAVSNLCAAMEAMNVILRKKGPLGFISHDAAASKDATAGYVPMDDEEKMELQQDLAKYGMSWEQFQYVISKTPVRWNPISFNFAELGIDPTILGSARAICQRFGFPYVLFQDSDSTYSNQASAHKKFFDDVVLPQNKKDFNKYNKFFKAKENNCIVKCDYSHLGVFQEDELNRGRARSQNDLGLQIEYLNDIITKNQWLEELGLEQIGAEGDKLYSQSAQKMADNQAKMDQLMIAKGAASNGKSNGQAKQSNGQQVDANPGK